MVAGFGWVVGYGSGFVTVVAGFGWAADFGGGYVIVVTGFGGYCMVLPSPLLSYETFCKKLAARFLVAELGAGYATG